MDSCRTVCVPRYEMSKPRNVKGNVFGEASGLFCFVLFVCLFFASKSTQALASFSSDLSLHLIYPITLGSVVGAPMLTLQPSMFVPLRNCKAETWPFFGVVFTSLFYVFLAFFPLSLYLARRVLQGLSFWRSVHAMSSFLF